MIPHTHLPHHRKQGFCSQQDEKCVCQETFIKNMTIQLNNKDWTTCHFLNCLQETSFFLLTAE